MNMCIKISNVKGWNFQKTQAEKPPLCASSSAFPAEVVIVSVYTCGFLCAFEHVVIKNRSISQKHLSLVALILSEIFLLNHLL